MSSFEEPARTVMYESLQLARFCEGEAKLKTVHSVWTTSLPSLVVRFGGGHKSKRQGIREDVTIPNLTPPALTGEQVLTRPGRQSISSPETKVERGLAADEWLRRGTA
jgi:hypothetical protein